MNERVVMYHVRFNGLATGYINVWIHKKDMATHNDGHPSFNHDLMHKNSSADPR